jgi:hypothetical protein
MIKNAHLSMKNAPGDDNKTLAPCFWCLGCPGNGLIATLVYIPPSLIGDFVITQTVFQMELSENVTN